MVLNIQTLVEAQAELLSEDDLRLIIMNFFFTTFEIRRKSLNY